MKDNTFICIFVIIWAFVCSTIIFTSPEKVISKDEDYIYTEKYSLFNRDTIVCKYSKPILYNGVCIDKSKFRTYNAAAKPSVLFKRVTILYDNKEYTLNDYYLYNNLEIGDTCLVVEYFYPYRETKIELYGAND